MTLLHDPLGGDAFEPPPLPAADPVGPALARHRSLARRFTDHPAAVVALVGLVLVVLIAVFAPLVAPYDPTVQNLQMVLKPPSSQHWFGTDELGRDVLSRLIYGSRVSLIAAAEAVVIGVVLGVPLGLLAGYVGGGLDSVVSRVADGILSFPPLLLAIAIVGVLGTGLTNAMVAIGVVFAPRFYRLVRASVLGVREEAYVDAARTMGCSHRHIVVRHVLPNVSSPLVIQVMMTVGLAMLSEAGLSFLGLGVQPPQASWGAMLGSAARNVSRAPWLAVFPGLAIVIVVLACNTVGDGLRAAVGRPGLRR